MPRDVEEQRDILESSGSTESPVFWYVEGDDEVPSRIYVGLYRDNTLTIFSRSLNSIDDSSCDEVLALIIREAALGLLVQDETEDNEEVFQRSSDWAAVGAGPTEVSNALATSPEIAGVGTSEPQVVEPDIAEEETSLEARPAILGLQAGYGFELWGESKPLVHTIPVGVRVRVFRGLFFRLSYRFVLPYTIADKNIQIELHRHGLRFDIGYGHSWRYIFLEASAGLLFDVHHLYPEASLPLLAVEDDPFDLEVALNTSLRLGVAPISRLRLELGLGVDVPVSKVAYTVGTIDGPWTVAETWPARLLMFFELSVHLW